MAAAELSEAAMEKLFLELGIKPEVTGVGKLKHYAGGNIDIFVGDIFNLSASILGRIDTIYDPAALVVLPEDMRRQYSSHLMKITGRARQFAIVFEYDQALLAGPPFSIDANEVSLLYSDVYRLQAIESVDGAGGLKGICAAKGNAWLLSNSDHQG
ncbi:MAG: thiopurine S-methyltransferase [Zhongshania sp.]